MRVLISLLLVLILPQQSFAIIDETVTTDGLSGRTCRRGETDPKLCLVCTVFHESRGESEDGKIAVAQTILTRLERGYARTLCGVVFAPGQFSWTNRRAIALPNADALRDVVDAVNKALRKGPNGLTHFHNRHVSTDWIQRGCRVQAEIGLHLFYTCRAQVDLPIQERSSLVQFSGAGTDSYASFVLRDVEAAENEEHFSL